jgi:hypothetical protein
MANPVQQKTRIVRDMAGEHRPEGSAGAPEGQSTTASRRVFNDKYADQDVSPTRRRENPND